MHVGAARLGDPGCRPCTPYTPTTSVPLKAHSHHTHPAGRRLLRTACWPAAAPPAWSTGQGRARAGGHRAAGASARRLVHPGHHSQHGTPSLRAGCLPTHLPHPHLQRAQLQLLRQLGGRRIRVPRRQHCVAREETRRAGSAAGRAAARHGPPLPRPSSNPLHPATNEAGNAPAKKGLSLTTCSTRKRPTTRALKKNAAPLRPP